VKQHVLITGNGVSALQTIRIKEGDSELMAYDWLRTFRILRSEVERIDGELYGVWTIRA